MSAQTDKTYPVWRAMLAAACGSALCSGVAWAQPIHHDISVTLTPAVGGLAVEDTITFPKHRADHRGTFRFALHRAFTPSANDREARIVRLPDGLADSIDHYEVSLPRGKRTVTLSYGGRLIQSGDTEILGEHGDAVAPHAMVLSHASAWYPTFDAELITFTLSARAPSGWEVVSQGRFASHRVSEGHTSVRWESPEPQDEIYLVAGPLTRYSRKVGDVTAMAYLRAPDEALADRYLDATGRYLTLFGELFGPYPYSKFAMVENAWETGFGMPSFTLLGSTVIRLPFILDSSYPHEILHNWWGNGVFVDPTHGNWSEGLTAYLADHLVAEQRGTGPAHRRAVLQKYADYVTRERDFPLTDFRARHSPATEAVGYGKALMLFHMVRRELGDDKFLRALRTFFDQHRFRRATFLDLDRAFAAADGRRTGPLKPWIEKAGAPALKISNAEALPLGDRYLLEALVEQTQPGPVYPLRIPLAVTIEGQEHAYQTTVALRGKWLGLELAVPGRPVRVDLDPEFDLFRRLDRAELPPALSQLFGAERVTAVLPSAASPELRDGYRRLAESLVGPSGAVEVVLDDETAHLPADRALWVLGWENRFRPAVAAAAADLGGTLGEAGVLVSGNDLSRARHSVVLVVHQRDAPDLAVGWVATDVAGAMPGLARKLRHYGKYGYLGFDGVEPTNVVKGEWAVVRSPLSVRVKQPDGSFVEAPRGRLASRTVLGRGQDAAP